MRLTDAHAHLCDPAFDPDLGAVLDRARAAGVEAVVAVGETLRDALKNLELAARFPGVVLPAAGLYPVVLDPGQAEALDALVRERRGELAAIGEVGLDHWKVQDEAGREMQKEIFLRFVGLSLELDLPLNVHSRSASRDAVSLLLARGARRVLLHAFDGKVSTALPAVEAGYFFSIPPSIVRSPQKQKLARRLPLSCLLLETDSPVLGPAPGVRNEPADLAVALAAVAEIREIPVEEVADAAAENARRLFGDRFPFVS
jgi:TatD DNase family protein